MEPEYKRAFYILAREFGYTDRELAEMSIPFMLYLLDNLKRDYEEEERRLKKYG